MNHSRTLLLAASITALASLFGCGAPVDEPLGAVVAADDDGPGAAEGGAAAGGDDGTTEGNGGSGPAGSGGAAGTAGAGGAEAVAQKHNPGHYISMRPTDGDAEILDSLRPGVSGVQIRYPWKSLEPSEGQYDFAELESHLDRVASEGRHLIAMVVDKSFSGSVPTPSYLANFILPNKPGGYTAMRWDPYVVARLEALMQALGTAFDDHPGLEGLAVQETALSLTSDSLGANGYTPEKYRDAQIQLLTTMKAALPHSQVFWYMNFLTGHQSYLGDIATAVAPLGVSMGGPDILPENYALLTHTYPFYEQFAGSMPLFCSSQYDSYEHVNSATGEFYTPEEIFEYGRDVLHVSYVMWNRKTWATPAGSYNWLDALPVIEQNPTFN